MVLPQHTNIIEIKEWSPSYELERHILIKKKDQPHMQLQNHGTYYRYDSIQHSEQ